MPPAAGGGTLSGSGTAATGGRGGGGGCCCCWPRVGTEVTSVGGGTDMATAVTGGPNLLTRPAVVAGAVATSPADAVVEAGEAVPDASFFSQGILPTRGATFLPLVPVDSPDAF